MSTARETIDKLIKEKSVLKQDVFHNTIANFRTLKTVLHETVEDLKKRFGNTDQRVEFYYKDRGEFQAEVKIAGDILIFQMHTNVFQFDKSHNFWKSGYFKDNDENSYIGIINVYNFLADSFKYQREADIGYLIARLFVNKENHFMVQGKRQLGYLYNDFLNTALTKELMADVVDSVILYTLDFDMYTPPYENMQIVTVEQIQDMNHNHSVATGKRLGFRFGLEDSAV
ncbi:MAG: hypothetical protein ACOVOO_08140 [Flavobacteriales bacterium]|jgi:hypothetical protein